jgi:hypothetical protein
MTMRRVRLAHVRVLETDSSSTATVKDFLSKFVNKDVTGAFGEMDLEEHEEEPPERRGTYLKQLVSIDASWGTTV